MTPLVFWELFRVIIYLMKIDTVQNLLLLLYGYSFLLIVMGLTQNISMKKSKLIVTTWFANPHFDAIMIALSFVSLIVLVLSFMVKLENVNNYIIRMVFIAMFIMSGAVFIIDKCKKLAK
jgi:hypothetical protein